MNYHVVIKTERAVALLVALLAGCAATVHSETGPVTPSPGGWDTHCATQPTPKECSK